MKLCVAALAVSLCFGQAASTEPTRQEIADAYRSKTGQGGLLVPGLRWEHFRVKQVRGWTLKFKRLSEERTAALMTFHYEAVARKNNLCASYQITDVILLPPPNPQVRLSPRLTVEPNGVTNCR